MNEEDRKRLTEWLGECWHEAMLYQKIPHRVNFLTEVHCKCGAKYGTPNRTFTDPDDFFACFERLVELGKWVEFDEWAYMKWDSLKPFNDLSRNLGEHSKWLLSKTDSGHMRLCVLVAEARKEGKV